MSVSISHKIALITGIALLVGIPLPSMAAKPDVGNCVIPKPTWSGSKMVKVGTITVYRDAARTQRRGEVTGLVNLVVTHRQGDMVRLITPAGVDVPGADFVWADRKGLELQDDFSCTE